MSISSLAKTNKLVTDMSDILSLFADNRFFRNLKTLELDWHSGAVSGLPADIVAIFQAKGFVITKGASYILTPRGISFLGKLLVDIEALTDTRELDGKYIIEKIISSGKNSVTFKARHKFIGRNFALKVIRPGSGEDIIKKLEQIGQVGGAPYLVHPMDYFEIDHYSLNGKPIKLKCLVFPYIEGETLDAFLSRAKPISPFFIYSFIKQSATALAALEAGDLYHGDLHSNNILVTRRGRDGILFQIIDVSCGIGDPSPYDYGFNDFQHFKEHLWRSLRILQKNLPRMSIRKHLGSELFSLSEHILNQDSMMFAEVLSLLENRTPYITYKEKQAKFIQDKFSQKSEPMGLLRYEEFTDHQVAMELFEPYPELIDEISKFGNAVIYGHRGSGKSTYLSALSCFPEINQPLFDMKEKFGIFFACRQGEFKQFSPDLINDTAKNILFIKHIVVLKIIRRFIDILNDAIRRNKATATESIEKLFEFLNQFIAEGAAYHYDREIITPLENLHASLLRNEINEIDRLFSSEPTYTHSQLLNERKLIDFFQTVKSVIPELGNAKFYILFDDAGEPNVPKLTQWIINDIMRCVNSTYCIKLSAERFSYEFRDTKAKAIEESHDYSSFDISQTLSLGSGVQPERRKLKNYFKKIIEKRLSALEYASFDIVDYLGDKLIETDELVYRLVNSRRDAYYCGWNAIWELSNRTTRNLLELVSEILVAGGVTKESEPKIIAKHVQHQIIKAFSEKKLKSLVYIPGKIVIQQKEYGLGIKLYEFAASFGKVSREYLQKKQVKSSNLSRKRFDERIAIERDDFDPLSKKAELFLQYLIRFAVLDDVDLVVSRDDKLKKPIYTLNRIFCPAFSISFRRDSHLRLGRKKLEMLLLHPRDFVKRGTKFLEGQGISEGEMGDLFGRINDK